MKPLLGTRDDRGRTPILRTRRSYLLPASLLLVASFAFLGIYKLTRAHPLPPPGKNALIIRGQPQDVYFYPAQGAPAHAPKVLFLCGDGGWEGLSLSIAAEMAKAGYDVYGFDTKRYLASFTTNDGALKDTDVQHDLDQVAKWMQTRWRERVTLVGQSEGAGLAVIAAADPNTQDVFSGVITLGLSTTAELGWSLRDDVTYITHADPNEPMVRATDYLPKITPLPFCMIQSSVDQFITKQEVDALFTAAQQPKVYKVVQAQNHSFGGNLNGFVQALREGLAWVNQKAK